MNGAISAAVVFLINYYLNLRVDKNNQKIYRLIFDNQMTGYQISSTIKWLITEQNRICEQLISYNKFWSKLYIVFIMTIIPMNLRLLQEFLFEVLKLYVKILVGFPIIIQFILIFQFLLVSLSNKIHRYGKKLSQLQWGINGWPFGARTKIKLLICFERLSTNRKIGFSIGSLAVMTFPMFYKVMVWLLINIRYYNLESFFNSAFVMILTLIPIYTFLLDTLIASVFSCLMTYFLKLRAEKVNKNINEFILNNRLIGHRIWTALKPFIYEYNRVCVQLSNYDEFWSKLCFYFVFTIILMN